MPRLSESLLTPTCLLPFFFLSLQSIFFRKATITYCSGSKRLCHQTSSSEPSTRNCIWFLTTEVASSLWQHTLDFLAKQNILLFIWMPLSEMWFSKPEHWIRKFVSTGLLKKAFTASIFLFFFYILCVRGWIKIVHTSSQSFGPDWCFCWGGRGQSGERESGLRWKQELWSSR